MKDKICIITGSTSGIGLSTAKALSKMGATVGIVGRNESRTAAAKAEVIQYSKNDNVKTFIADLSSQKQLHRLATEIKSTFNHIDVLVNNAGAVFVTPQYSDDKIEMQFATNHLSYFLLTHLLSGHLKKAKSGRIINVSSNAHFKGKIDFSDLYHEKNYQGFKVYSSAKLANVLFTYELAKKLRGTNVTVNAVHPGVVKTGIGNKHTKFWMGWIWNTIAAFGINADKGAETSVYLASSESVEGVSGKYFYKSKIAKSSQLSHDENSAKKLWEVSEHLCKLRELSEPSKA